MFEVLQEISQELEKTGWENILIKTGIAAIIITGTLGSCHMINQKVGLDDDNIFEERIEEKIKEETGIDVDLTPNSKESLS